MDSELQRRLHDSCSDLLRSGSSNNYNRREQLIDQKDQQTYKHRAISDNEGVLFGDSSKLKVQMVQVHQHRRVSGQLNEHTFEHEVSELADHLGVFGFQSISRKTEAAEAGHRINPHPEQWPAAVSFVGLHKSCARQDCHDQAEHRVDQVERLHSPDVSSWNGHLGLAMLLRYWRFDSELDSDALVLRFWCLDQRSIEGIGETQLRTIEVYFFKTKLTKLVC